MNKSHTDTNCISTKSVERVLSLKDVIKLTGLSKSTVYLYIQESMFPTSIKLGIRRVGWLEYEIQDWLNNKIAQSRQEQAFSRSTTQRRMRG